MIDSRDHGEVILGAVWTMLRPLGTTLGSPGTMLETPLLLFGQSVVLCKFQGNSLTLLGVPLSPLGVTFSLRWVSESEKKCLCGQRC